MAMVIVDRVEGTALIIDRDVREPRVSSGDLPLQHADEAKEGSNSTLRGVEAPESDRAGEMACQHKGVLFTISATDPYMVLRSDLASDELDARELKLGSVTGTESASVGSSASLCCSPTELADCDLVLWSNALLVVQLWLREARRSRGNFESFKVLRERDTHVFDAGELQSRRSGAAWCSLSRTAFARKDSRLVDYGELESRGIRQGEADQGFF